MKSVVALQAMRVDEDVRPESLFNNNSWFSVSSSCRMPGTYQCP